MMNFMLQCYVIFKAPSRMNFFRYYQCRTRSTRHFSLPNLILFIPVISFAIGSFVFLMFSMHCFRFQFLQQFVYQKKVLSFYFICFDFPCQQLSKFIVLVFMQFFQSRQNYAYFEFFVISILERKFSCLHRFIFHVFSCIKFVFYCFEDYLWLICMWQQFIFLEYILWCLGDLVSYSQPSFTIIFQKCSSHIVAVCILFLLIPPAPISRSFNHQPCYLMCSILQLSFGYCLFVFIHQSQRVY